MQLAGSRSAMSEINVAPMIDVMLVLLIIFMVMTPVVMMGYRVKVPPTAAAAVPVDVPLVVRLADDGRVFLNRDAVESDVLATKLRDYASAHPGRMVFFAGSRKASYEETMGLLDQMHSVGVTNIGIVVEKMEASR